jgi:hypothetical protein
VSAREWRAVREGEAHAAPKTSRNNTPESFIVGVGASGALLAGAAIVFVTLVGLVSFNVWPTGAPLLADQNVELSTATPNSSSAGTATTPVNAASGQLASTSTGTGSSATGTGSGSGTSSAGGGGGNGDQVTGGGKGGQPKASLTNPPATNPAPTTGSGDTASPPLAISAPGTASKSPAHPVHPTHPDTPHQNLSDGTQGKDNGTDNSQDEVTGKGPLSKPPSSDSDSDAGTTSTSKSHGSSKSKH